MLKQWAFLLQSLFLYKTLLGQALPAYGRGRIRFIANVMGDELARIALIFVSGMFKFFMAPVGGFVAGFHPLFSAFLAAAGMMFSVLIFTFFGAWVKPRVIALFPRLGRRFSKRNRRFVRLWGKYGMIGIAALTPPLLTPVIGTLLAVSFGVPRHSILLYMLASALVWALIATFLVYVFGHAIFPGFIGV